MTYTSLSISKVKAGKTLQSVSGYAILEMSITFNVSVTPVLGLIEQLLLIESFLCL